ncbi:MAG: alpha/beta hydrolase family protein [Planctomycetota bacterium]
MTDTIMDATTFWELLDRRAAHSPDLPLLIDESGRSMTCGEVRDERFEGAGGTEIQMFVLRPPGHEAGEKRPLVHMIHGGPHGTFGDTWLWRWHAAAFAARGFVVACVNFQGSTSFGQDFAKRIQGAWGERPYEDVMRSTDHLIAEGLVDDGRMAITGGSYGGYLTAWIASRTHRFQCAVNHAGVYDLTLQYASDHTAAWHRATGGTPWDGQERVDRWDPARHSEHLATPMLVVHGEKDYRVPVSQGLLCYGILKAKGIPARLLYFEDENHWILKPQNSLRWYDEVLGWLDRFLAPKEGGDA